MTNNVNPSMVTLARQSRGKTQTQLAKDLGCQQGTISKIEQGELEVSEAMLQALSKALTYPVAFFQQPGEVYAPGLKHNRVRKSLPKKVREQIEASLNIRARELGRLLRNAEYDVHVPVLPIDRVGSPELVAQAVREVWGIPRGPIHNLTNILEDNGIIIIQHDFGTEKWDGVYLPFRNLPPILFINNQMPGDRMRFTKAHEAGHVIMHRLPKAPDQMEDEANRFAAEFLMPREDIEPYLKQVDLPNLARLKKWWGVSMAALLRRAKTLGKISDRRYRYLWMQMGKAGWRTREPKELDIPREKPALRTELLELHRKDFAYGTEQLSELVILNPDEFQQEYPDTNRLRLVR